ncbi:hypothetical protein PO909_013779 [Leuciscus waleckii]
MPIRTGLILSQDLGVRQNMCGQVQILLENEGSMKCSENVLVDGCVDSGFNKAQWTKVLFSDESKFCISFGNQGPRVWKKNGEAHNPRCLKSSLKFPQSVLVWGAMSSAGVGPLCCPLNAAVYQDIPSADKLYGDADFIFQQDLHLHCQKNQNLVQ